MKSIVTLVLTGLFVGASLITAADKTDKEARKKDPEALFKKLDTNADGTVTKEEYLASKKSKKDPAKAEKKFGKIDANADGKLSKEESAALVGRKSKTETPAAPAKTEESKPEEKKPPAPK